MAVGRPRVGVARARHEPGQRRARRRPQPERAVDVHPRAVLARRGDDVGQRVDRAGVHVARLRAHDRGAVAGRAAPPRARPRASAPARRPAPPRPPPARSRAAAARARPSRAPPRPPARAAAGAPLSPRSSRSQPARASSAPRAAASPVTFAICAPVVSPAPASRGQPEQLQQPPARDLLHHRRGRRGDRAEGVLVPRRREPVGRQRRRQRAAGHEPEVARARRGDEPRRRVARERLDHLLGRLARRRQRAAERRPQLRVPGERAGVALADGRRGGPPRARRCGRAGRGRSRAHPLIDL